MSLVVQRQIKHTTLPKLPVSLITAFSFILSGHEIMRRANK